MQIVPRKCRDIPLIRFFFQAEDGIRDWSVTGVQTCALPISRLSKGIATGIQAFDAVAQSTKATNMYRLFPFDKKNEKIGRASCRERVKISVVAVSLKKKKERNEDERAGRK